LKAAQSVLEIPIFNRLMEGFELAKSANISGKSSMFLTTLQWNKIVQQCRQMIKEYLLKAQDLNIEDLGIAAQEFVFQMFSHQIDPNHVKWYKASLNTFGGFHHSSNNFKDYFIKFIGYSGLKNDFVLPHGKVKKNLNVFTPDDLYRRNKTAYNKIVGTKYDIIIR
jgi:hypothetical protein